MPHLLDASGNPITHGRPSPRTGSTGVGIQKFGTQQLKMLETGEVIEKDVGARTRLAWIESAGGGSGVTTAFSQRYQQQRPTTITTLEQLDTSPHAIPEGWLGGQFEFPDLFGGGEVKEKCHLDDNKPFCAITQAIGGEVCECPDWFTGKVTDPTADGRGCECEACKNGTGQCDADVPECDAWDLLCTGTGGASKGIVGGTDVWLWVKIILVLIGIGIFLWLLRPLFGVAKNITET